MSSRGDPPSAAGRGDGSDTRRFRQRAWLVAAAGTARPALAAAVALVLVGVSLALLGYSPGRALAALVTGSLGSAAAWTATLLKAAPLLLTGLAVALAFRPGVWNIGAEGQLLAGALFATALATRVAPHAPAFALVPALVCAGMLGGALFGALAGVLRAVRGVSEVISTILRSRRPRARIPRAICFRPPPCSRPGDGFT